MPLPQDVEDQIADVERAVAPFAAALLAAFLRLDSSAIPSWEAISKEVAPKIRKAIKDTIVNNGAPTTPAFIDAQTVRVLDDLEKTWNVAASEMTDQIRKVKADTPDDDGPAGWLRTVALVAAGTIVTRSRKIATAARRVAAAGGRFPRQVLKQASTLFDIPVLSRRINVEAHMRMIVRTEVAKIRNTNAAYHADNNGLVLYIRDALIDTDCEPCVAVDKRYATSRWLQNNLVEHPNCVLAGQIVDTSGEFLAAWSRPFQGEIIYLVTAFGNCLSVTPNHPILTTGGFRPADSLQPGTEVLVYRSGVKRVSGQRPDDVNAVLVEDVAIALVEAGSVTTVQVPSAAEQFHGDGTADGQVDVVYADSFLRDNYPHIRHGYAESLLVGGPPARVFHSESAPGEVLVGSVASSDRIVGSFGEGGPSVASDAFHVEPLGVAPGSGESPLPQAATDSVAGDVVVNRDHVGRFPREIPPGDLDVDRVVSISKTSGRFYVHDLSTSVGWFSCNNIVTGNCTRSGTAMELPDGAEVTLI